MSVLIGEIVRKDEMICVQTGPNVWIPLGGNSAFAERFRESFNDPAPHDVGRRLYIHRGVIQMENMEQMKRRRLGEGIGMGATAKKHFVAIEAGAVTKSNVIGIRKALNHVERLRAGWSGNRSSVTPDEADALEAALKRREPQVVGELETTGLALLRSPRWAKRWSEREAAIISRFYCFALVRFDRIGRDGLHAVPVYRVKSKLGPSFLFRNLPWQTAFSMGEESGPIVVGENS